MIGVTNLSGWMVAVIFLQEVEARGVPWWVYLGIILLILVIFAWALINRPWETTVAEKEEMDSAATVAVAEPVGSGMAEAPADDAEPQEAAVDPDAPVSASSVVTEAESMVEKESEVGESIAAPPAADDLKRIEGIGPKIQQILADNGISTFASLASTDVSTLNKIIREDAGITIAFPDTWPQQALMAANGDWTGLEKLQANLKGGREDDD